MSDKQLITDPARITGCHSAVKSAARAAHGGLAKRCALALTVIAGLSAAPDLAATAQTQAEASATIPVAFIRDLGNRSLAVIRSEEPLYWKTAYFERMIHWDFDLTSISQFELGPYWRVASPTERQEFSDLFADHLIRFFGRRLAQYGDGSFIVTGSRSDSAGVVVTSEIIGQSTTPLAVNWQLAVSDGHYRVEDVIINGVSMALAQRSEIAAIIARNGGQFGPLLATMRE